MTVHQHASDLDTWLFGTEYVWKIEKPALIIVQLEQFFFNFLKPNSRSKYQVLAWLYQFPT